MSERLLKVGAAKLSISPTDDMMPLIASLSDNEVYSGIREGEDINVRAIVVDNGEERFLFEAFELSNVPNPEILHERLEEQYGLSKECMLLSATHNHSAPHMINYGMDHLRRIGPRTDNSDNVKRYTENIMNKAVEVVGLAIANMKPAKYGYAEDKSYININRDKKHDDGFWMQSLNWEGCSDKTLSVIKFEDYDGNLIAAVLNYAMHSVGSHRTRDLDGKIKITCDIPGIACNLVEKHYGNDAVVLWQSGAAGNQNPIRLHICRYDVNGTLYNIVSESVPGAAYSIAVNMGEEHGVDALRALKKAEAKKTWLKIRRAETTLYFPGQKFPEGVDYTYHRLMVDNLLVDRGYMKPGETYEKKLVDMIPTDEKVPMRAQLILFGDVAFYGVACELYNEIALICKEVSPFKNLVITTHIGAPSVGYILDDDSKGHKVFQSFGLVREGESNGIVVNGMLDLFDQALAQ